MNFALILFVFILITGVISLADICFFKGRRKGQAPGFIIEQSRSFFPLLLSVFVLRSFLIEPFRIPSGSLEPTLRVGDFVAVNKFAYGVRLPIIERKILSINEPKTGDITVFRWPPDPSFDYIKRVIGVPGDKIAYHDKVLTINGVQAKQKFIGYTVDESSGQTVAEYEEVLGNVKHSIFIRPDTHATDFEIVVPQHQYFMMGDNRDDSADSRFWGFVDDKFLRGRAALVWMSWDNQKMHVRWSRIGHWIH